MTPEKTPNRHIDAILNMAAKAYRLGKVDLARRLLGRLDDEPLTPEQAAWQDRALQVLREG